MVQEAKSPAEISSGSVARRDLVPALKGLSLLSQASTLDGMPVLHKNGTQQQITTER
jgi:hypothetical protein